MTDNGGEPPGGWRGDDVDGVASESALHFFVSSSGWTDDAGASSSDALDLQARIEILREALSDPALPADERATAIRALSDAYRVLLARSADARVSLQDAESRLRNPVIAYPARNEAAELPVVAPYPRLSARPASRSWADVKRHFGKRSGTSNEAFAEHARLVEEIQSDADAVLSASGADVLELAARARESGWAVDDALVRLFLQLGPPPTGSGFAQMAPVDSGGGAQE